MAPSPAAGKASSDQPRTPTKLGRKPQSQRTPKLGESAQQASGKASEATQQQKPSAPEVEKPETDTPDLPPRPSEGDVTEKAGGAKKTAEDAPKQAQQQAGDVSEKDPTGKVSEATEGLTEQEPKPVEEAEDVAGGAQQQTEEQDDDDDDDDNATEKAGDLGEDTADDAEDTAESAQESAGDAQEQAGGAVEGTKKAGGSVLDGAKGLAGRASNLAGKSAQDPSKAATETAEGAKDTAGETAEGTTEGAQDVAEGAKGTAEETAEGAKDTAEGATEDLPEGAEEAAEGAKDTAEGATKDLPEGAEEAADGAKDTADGATKDLPEGVEEAADGAKDTAEGATDEAKEGVDGAKDTAEDTTGQDLPDVPDLSILKGLEIQEDGKILDKDGNAIGQLAEGDAEDLQGYSIGDDGEILDDDGDLVGRCELLPEKIEQMKKDAEDTADDAADKADGPKLPDLSILKGLKVNQAGEILNDDGDTVGRVVEGDVADLNGMTVNENGEILDDDGDVVGRCEVHPDAANLVDEAEDELPDGVDADEAGEAVDGAKDEAGEAVDGVTEKAGDAEDAVDGVKDKAEEAQEEIPDLPGVEALEGKEINEQGEIVDSEGNVLGNVEEGVDLDKVKGLTVNDKGEVVDEDGNVLGKVELAEGAAEKLKEQLGPMTLDLRILDGMKVNKKGKVLNEDGEEIGQLTEGDVKKAAGKFINDKGEVLDKDGNVVGKVEVVPGEAADEAMTALRERLGELPEEPQEYTPDLDILDGLKVNKKGQVLNEDGDPIGELEEGELALCAGKKINEKGEVLDRKGNVIGKVRVLPQQLSPEETAEQAEEAGEEAGEEVPEGEEAAQAAEEAQEGAEEAQEGAEDAAEDAEDAAEDAGPELPPLSILDGLKVNKAGKLVNDDGVIVGELTEGDAKKLSKGGFVCNENGEFFDNKGKVIGRAQTVPTEEGDEESPFAGLEGLIVVKGGMVEDENGNTVGQVVEGDPKKLVGRAVDEDGDIIDKKGSVIGHAERWEEPEAEQEPEEEPEDLSSLAGRTLNKAGMIIGDEGVPIGRLVEGNPKELAGKKVDGEGQIWNDQGQVIGRCELIPDSEREAKPEGPFAGLEDLRVVQDGKVADADDNIVGQIVEGNPKRLVGLKVDEDGDIVDRYGNVKGHAEPLEDEPEEEPEDLSILDGKMLNKQGLVVDESGVPLGRLVEGNVSELAGRKCDEQGQIHNDTGKVVGRCELIPENERVAKPEGPFAGLEGLKVVKDGKVEDIDGNVVGEITEGDPKRLIGHTVDEDGDIIDKFGNVKGHAEPWEEEEQPEEDLSALAGCTVNKAGNVVDSAGAIVGHVAEGDPSTMIGKKVDGKGQIWDNAGNVIGRAELAKGHDTSPEGPFAGFDSITVTKDGMVVTPDGSIVGRVIEGDVKKLISHKVDEQGDIVDKNGNVIGKAERWEPEEKERRINPMSGRRVNKEGEIRDENGDLMGRLTAGDLGHCVGLEVDDNGYVVDNDGNKVGEVTLLANIIEEEEEEPEEETEEEKKRREDAELADKMANICQQTLERVQPICKQITEYIEKADRTPREELDEEQLVSDVKPLIEEAGRILQECNGSLRGLDPDGRIAAQAKGRAGTREATPEEYRLADCLKELTTTVVTTIDNAKKKISDMPHAKKKLNPLWSLLTEPLFQIIAAVGLLLSGVLGLVGRLLNGLGLGGLVNGLLGGLGIDKLLSGLGLGSVTEALGGGKKKEKKGNAASGLPIVGGLFGGK